MGPRAEFVAGHMAGKGSLVLLLGKGRPSSLTSESHVLGPGEWVKKHHLPFGDRGLGSGSGVLELAVEPRPLRNSDSRIECLYKLSP